MTEDDPIGLAAREALWMTLQLGGPPLVAILAVGLAVSLLQALTQMQEASLAFLPKLAALAAVLLAMGGGMSQALVGFAQGLFDRAIAVGGLP